MKRLLGLTITWVIFHGLLGQELKVRNYTKEDSTFRSAYYLSLAQKALDRRDYLQVINYYEMARVCNDYSTKIDKINWHAAIREMQKSELTEKEQTIESLRRSNAVIQASNLALRSLSSENDQERVALALKAYDSLSHSDKIDIFSSTNVLHALHNAYNSLYANRTKLNGGIRMVRQTSDTTAKMLDLNGNFISLFFNNDGCHPTDTITNLNPLLVQDFSWDKNTGNFAFAGMYPAKRNKLVITSDKKENRAIVLPKDIKSVHALTFLKERLVFVSSDETIRYITPNGSDQHFPELFATKEKPSCLEVSDDELYIGTRSGDIFRWNNKEKITFTISRQSSNVGVSKIKVLNDKEGNTLVVGGYVDGSVRLFKQNADPKQYSSQHRDYITELLTSLHHNLLIRMSVDCRVSVSRLVSEQNDSTPIVLKYDKLNPPVGINFSSRYNCLFVFLKDGFVDTLHFDLSYYVVKLNGNSNGND